MKILKETKKKKMFFCLIFILISIIMLITYKKYKSANSPLNEFYILEQDDENYFGEETPSIYREGEEYYLITNLTKVKKGINLYEIGAIEITTSDEKFRFGVFDIGVGSPKWLVKFAYFPYEKIAENNSEEYGIIESDLVVLTFYFDEKNNVKKVSYGMYP